MEKISRVRLLNVVLWMWFWLIRILIYLIDKIIFIDSEYPQQLDYNNCNSDNDQEFSWFSLLCTENARRVPSASGGTMTVLPSAHDGPRRHDFDGAGFELTGMGPMALQNIREQMALSLERTKQLEDQVKLVPELKVFIHLLLNVVS